MESELFMGCDISQDTFNYCLRNKAGIILQGQVSNTVKSIRSWLMDLKKNHQFNFGPDPLLHGTYGCLRIAFDENIA
jgi:hypothetical protein